MKLKSISISNLRSLKKIENIKLKPLTIIVGANSSGKSTFLRTLPLFRQSVETATKGPILWFGRFVDFGLFTDAVTKSSDNNEIEFGFKVELESNVDKRKPNYHFHFRRVPTILENIDIDINITVAEADDRSSTYIKEIRLFTCETEIKFKLTQAGDLDSLFLNSDEVKTDEYNLQLGDDISLFPIRWYLDSSKKKGRSIGIADRTGPFIQQIMDSLKSLFHHNTIDDTRAEFVDNLGIGNIDSFKTHLLQCVKTFGWSDRTYEKAVTLSERPVQIKKIQGLTLLSKLPFLMRIFDIYLTEVFQKVHYIGPLRATAQRFYRQQDLSVDEVDPQGANLAMFLMGLGPTKRAAFSTWCKKHLGFDLKAKINGAHVSIELKDESSVEPFNIADMGFGYSQILPVLATIWSSIYNENNKKRYNPTRRFYLEDLVTDDTRIISIEQPELHLHPELQAKVAELFANIAENVEGVHLLCETHSEILINYLGTLISHGKLDPNKVQILIFEKENMDSVTKLRESYFDKDGSLNNWPYGFFLPNS